LTDVPEVGGTNASLGELYTGLAAEGVRKQRGFTLTGERFCDALAPEAGTLADAGGVARNLIRSSVLFPGRRPIPPLPCPYSGRHTAPLPAKEQLAKTKSRCSGGVLKAN